MFPLPSFAPPPYLHSFHNNALGTYLSPLELSLGLFNRAIPTANFMYWTNLLVSKQVFKIIFYLETSPRSLVYTNVSENLLPPSSGYSEYVAAFPSKTLVPIS
jgi:hypothetical protein